MATSTSVQSICTEIVYPSRLASAVSTTIAREVPCATTCETFSSDTISGTMNVPPPMPASPENTPPPRPVRAMRGHIRCAGRFGVVGG